jgi:hypothetical protein
MANLRDVARQRIELRFARDVPADVLSGVHGITDVELVGRTAYVVADGSIAELIKRVAEYDVERIVSHHEDLEDVFFRYYQDGDSR